MTQLSGISGREAVKKFLRIGYRLIRQRGGHARLRHFDHLKRRPLTVPMHREIKIVLLHQLIRDAGISVAEFLDL